VCRLWGNIFPLKTIPFLHIVPMFFFFVRLTAPPQKISTFSQLSRYCDRIPLSPRLLLPFMPRRCRSQCFNKDSLCASIYFLFSSERSTFSPRSDVDKVTLCNGASTGKLRRIMLPSSRSIWLPHYLPVGDLIICPPLARHHPI